MAPKDPVIEHLRQESELNLHVSQITIDDDIFNQVALEGLSGITFTRLFQILEALHPKSNCVKDKKCQNHIWSVITKRYLNYPEDVNIKFQYVAIKKTAEQAVSTRQKTSNELISSQPPTSSRGPTIEKPLKLPPQTVQRLSKIDSLYPVQDGLSMGSCRDYLTRVDITKYVAQLAQKYESNPQEAIRILKNKHPLDRVYLVAGHLARSRILLPNWADPNVDIKLREYCVLELIGKTRSLGTIFPNDKTLGRYRIMLMAKGFIRQHQETNSSPIEHHIIRYSRNNHIHPNPIQPTANAGLIESNKNTIDRKSDSSSDEESKPTTKLPLSKLCCNPNKLKPDRSILAMVYDVIAESEKGLTQLEIRKKLLLPKFHVRNHLKNLLSLKMICSHISKNNDNPFRIFNTAHKSVRQKKKKKEPMMEAKGIMAKWDERDLRAKKIIGHKRSSFSQAEDSLLILCRIASLLIEPNLKLSWCVHKRLVRDILHDELVESHDKTSDACLRRIKYLKRLTNNIMSINELTAELRDDVDISRLIRRAPESKQPLEGDEKLNKFFIQVLKLVRDKTPNLLGLTSGIMSPHNLKKCQLLSIGQTPTSAARLIKRQTETKPFKGQQTSNPLLSCNIKPTLREDAIEIHDHEQLKRKYDLVDCQSIVAIKRARLYELPKNKVDARLNAVRLVTMAFNLTNSLSPSKAITKPTINLPSVEATETLLGVIWSEAGPDEGVTEMEHETERRSKQSESARRRLPLNWLLDKFYAGYHDKLISSVLSNLNKRSLLTRKCGPEKGNLFKARAKMSLKLNQSVLFLLNRHQSSSLMQLARPIDRLYRIDLRESNEMFSIALLTCLCSSNSFGLDLELKIPSNVVGIDQGNENFKSLCEKANERTREILAKFMSRCGAINKTTKIAQEITQPSACTSRDEPMEEEEKEDRVGSKRAKIVNSDTETSETKLDKVGATKVKSPSEICALGNESEQQPGGGQRPIMATSAAAPTQSGSPFASTNKMDDSRRALFLLRHELKAHALDKCGSLSDCLIVQPCNVRFSSSDHLKSPSQALELFLAGAKPVDLIDDDKSNSSPPSTSSGSNRKQAPNEPQSSVDQWLVRSFRLPSIISEQSPGSAAATSLDKELEANKVQIEFSARLWKQIDGSLHLQTLFKLMESLLSWIIMFPGIERDLLEREFEHLMPSEHLLEMLNLMEDLRLIKSQLIESAPSRPRLFGKQAGVGGAEGRQVTTCYEIAHCAFVHFCQLLNFCK